MRNDVKKVPELRFPEFSGEWEEKKIGDLADIVRGASPRPISNPKWFDDKSNVGWLRIADVTEQNGRINHLKQKLSVEGQAKTRVVGEGHLLLSIAASVGKPVINYVKTGVHDGFLIFLRPIFNIEYMFQWLEYFKPKWQKYGQPGSQVNLNADLVKLQTIYIPNKAEQIRVAELFSKLDQQIELEEKKLFLLREQKKGYLQKIFSREWRFKDDEGNDYPEWGKRKLGDVAYVQNGFAFKSELFKKKGVPIVRISDITQSYVSEGTVFYDEVVDPKFVINKNDILIAMSGATTGKIGKYISDRPSLLNQRIGKFVTKEYRSNDFLYAYLTISNFRKNFFKLLVAGAQPNVSSQDIEKIKVKLPNIEEQMKIGDFFSDFDRQIELEEKKIDLLKKRKKGYLQKMFI